MKPSRLAPALALTVALLSAPVANATPSEDRAFLDALKGYHIQPNPGYSAQSLIDTGHDVCTDINNGFTVGQVADNLYMTGDATVTHEVASDFVDIAMAAYCPPDVQW